MIIEQVHQQSIQVNLSTTADSGAQWISLSKNDEKMPSTSNRPYLMIGHQVYGEEHNYNIKMKAAGRISS